jgi:transposase-like protein
VIERLAAGETGTALAFELSIKRMIIYRWRDAFREGGAEALRSKPERPAGPEALEMERALGG